MLHVYVLALAFLAPAWGYQGGKLPQHGHTSSSQGGVLSASTISNAGGVVSASTNSLTGATTFYGTLKAVGRFDAYSSTFTYLASDYDNGTSSACLAGSTVTLTCSGLYNLRYTHTGTVSVAGNSDIAVTRVLLDGDNIDGLAGGKSLAIPGNTGSTSSGSGSENFTYRGKSRCLAGSHTVCLIFTSYSGTATIHSLKCASWGNCFFGVEEVP